ncbi:MULTISPECIES: RICIN domain-containing protein [unclassified Rathayibacter]|uniref:RICIN domain-containing protein n=1 Tax=unclassified Rathayibacter TaxID=2609250 RepID=UPI001889F199|nr:MULTISPECIES: RICIN domain-containing protein [unclassified Rathayibacter]MBF4462593.1 ricin-type beta-trefoil lectin domain protein [Rathayibacter sp. VKM Ac-2879]MBF4503364.1 ricin-type beta-trefoil lectin domain protein [Rathayibacter sp. VKM Ac-2878]
MSRTKKRALSTLATAAILGFTVLGLSAPAQAAPVAPVGTGTAQEIRNAHSSMCLDDYGFNTQPGAEVRQWSCTEASNQRWSVRDLGTGYAEIKNTLSNLCLDDYNFATNPGAEVRQWTCWGGDVQQWQITDVGGGQSEIRNRYSNLCLENKDSAQVDGGFVQQNTCDSSKIQRWRLSDPTIEKITYTLERSANPSADELDAYARITDAMDRAVARYNRLNNIYRHLTVSYAPWVETADATISGYMRFGANRGFMQEGVALHEMSHTVGVGTAAVFDQNCANNGWNSALSLLRTWDGPTAVINCGGRHMWPYGLNYSNEYNELNFERHTKLVQAMLSDGM